MIVRPEHLARAMVLLLEQGMSFDLIAQNCKGYLEKYQQEHIYSEILVYIEKVQKEKSLRNTIDIVLARDADADNNTVLDILDYHHLNPENDYQLSTDNSIIGGYIIKSQGIVFDNSIRQRLQALRQELLNHSTSI